ncbi:hypothetical protein MTR_7g092420 [Medicago truncatula]|uniref:Uncharacterized protein n=1 Tax=Medicago truncatula TaxID=3880 RepID=G7KUE6_MEDTR|nr:hypothetical protein MTR_7g092420 [Medicago truncatula]
MGARNEGFSCRERDRDDYETKIPIPRFRVVNFELSTYKIHFCSPIKVERVLSYQSWVMRGAQGTVHIKVRTITQVREAPYSYPKP